MPDFTITVSANDAKIIDKLATKAGISGREFVENLLSNWAHGQIEGFFVEKIRGKTTDELIALLGDIL